MYLEKWYLDAVFPDGTVWFGYRAVLRFCGCLAIPWAACCEVLPDGTERNVSRWKVMPEPCLRRGGWRWEGPDGSRTRWTPSGAGVSSSLGSDHQLQIRWSCIAPRARVIRSGSLRNGGGRCAFVHGVGYLEHLQMNLRSLHFPFRVLRWGRAHAGESSLVWIHWAGGRDLCRLFENGVEVPGKIDLLPEGGVRVQTGTGVWETGNGRPICDRDVRRTFPRWLVRLAGGAAPGRELKMAGSSRLTVGSGAVTGSAIWEEVQWD